MASQQLQTYKPSKLPPLKGSEQRWVEDELRKIEAAIVALVAAVKELQDAP